MNGNCEACKLNDLKHSIRIRTPYCYVTIVVSKYLPSDIVKSAIIIQYKSITRNSFLYYLHLLWIFLRHKRNSYTGVCDLRNMRNSQKLKPDECSVSQR